jgi:hypothetical protein
MTACRSLSGDKWRWFGEYRTEPITEGDERLIYLEGGLLRVPPRHLAGFYRVKPDSRCNPR